MLKDSSSQAKPHFACRLAAQLYRKQQRVYLHTKDAQHARQIDQQLWTFREDSFIPHEIIIANENPQEQNSAETSVNSPVIIGFSADRACEADILINLTEEIPVFYRDFSLIAEIAPDEEQKRAVLRKHYRFYKDKNYELSTHNIE